MKPVTIKNPSLRLLALCTHFEPQLPPSEQIRSAAASITDWNTVPGLAENLGMAPLLNYQLKTAGVHLPIPVSRSLTAQGLRDRLINQERTLQMIALSRQFGQAGIPLLFLKGAALAHVLYPEPGLRPMSDLDILVDRSHLESSRRLLLEMGYENSNWPHDLQKSRHLPAFSKCVAGFNINIELHFALFQDKSLHPWFELKDLTSPPLSFPIAPDTDALTLGHEDMLFHLCQHVFFNNCGLDPLRLIWVADIINYAERFIDQINWDRVHRKYPNVLHVLSLLHFLSPLSENLILQASIRINAPPTGIGEDYQGWPIRSVTTWRTRGLLRFCLDTLFPSAWWLRLHYGVRVRAPLCYQWAQHILNLFGESRRRWSLRVHPI
jgi:hypothetical protein